MAMAAALALFLCSGCGSGSQAPFERLTPRGFQADCTHFSIDKPRGKIFFKKGKHQFELTGIPGPRGTYFYLNGKKQVQFVPGLTGDLRLYTHIFFKSLDPAAPAQVSLQQVTGKKGGKKEPRLLLRLASVEASRPFYKDLTLAGGGRLVFKCSGRGVFFLSPPVVYKKKPAAERRNIILIALDTMRADHIGLKVNNRSLTPNIDAFLGDGVYFKRAYAQTSWTLPSFMSLFTALNEYNHDVGVNTVLPLSKPFLVEPLSQRFITYGIHGGKVMKRRWGYWRGFDSYSHFRHAGALYPRGGQSLFQKAGQVLEEAQFSDLFLFLHTYQVHAPYTPPKEFLHRLNPTPLHTRLDAVNDGAPEKTYLPVEKELQLGLKELHQAEILAFDAYFGEFVQRLKSMGLYDNATIVFLSDHGEEFFEHLGWTHGHGLYDEQIRVPLAIKFPGNRFKGRRIESPAGLVDLMPTLLDYYGIEYSAQGLDGRGLMPVIENKGKRDPGYVVSSISTGRYSAAFAPKIALMFDRYKLLYNAPHSPKDLDFFKGHHLPPKVPLFELFDLAADPGEQNNIVSTSPGLRKKVMPQMVELQKLIRQKLEAAGKKAGPLDKKVEEQLKSLGYL